MERSVRLVEMNQDVACQSEFTSINKGWDTNAQLGTTSNVHQEPCQVRSPRSVGLQVKPIKPDRIRAAAPDIYPPVLNCWLDPYILCSPRGGRLKADTVRTRLLGEPRFIDERVS